MKGTTRGEASPRPSSFQATRALSGDQGAEPKHFQFQQGPELLLAHPVHALMPTDIIGANIGVEDADIILRARHAEPDRDRRPSAARERNAELHVRKYFESQQARRRSGS